MARLPGQSSNWHVRAGVAAVIVSAIAGIAHADVRPAETAAASWQAEQPMRLGFTDASPRRTELARVQSPRDNCRKWRRIAERLGETFAGLRLRQSVVDRACLFAATELASVTSNVSVTEPGFGHLWSWPWADGAIDPALPPRLHATFGDWTIRCGQAGQRERCALIHETAAMLGAAAGETAATGTAAPAKVVTHFVIDTIGGHTHMVWRVFAERREPGWFASTSAAGAELVRFSSGAIAGAKRFDGCSSAGCLMEADMATSARIATRLWEGAKAELTLNPAQGVSMTATVSAHGVRAGLAELARLKRSEDKQLARN